MRQQFQFYFKSDNKMAVCWDTAPCNVTEALRRVTGAYCFREDDEENAVSTSETSVNLYQTTGRNMPQNSYLHSCRRENLMPHPTKSYFRSCAKQGRKSR
jgi:hypothetical protein